MNSSMTNDFEFDKLLDDFISGSYDNDEKKTASEDRDIDEYDVESKEEKRKEINNKVKQSISDDFADIYASIEETEKKEQLEKEEYQALTKHLSPEERSLFEAYQNFRETIISMANEHNLNPPKFSIKADILYPKFKPSIGRAIAEDAVTGWDILLKVHSGRLSSIDYNATDEELLDFAEKTTDEQLQLAIISYVEILIEIEGCEISYERRKIANRKKIVEKEIYLEFKAKEERIKRYIEKIRTQNFPINEEELVKNYFKVSKKDEEGAYLTLITSPAVFSPILHHKIKSRFFGMIKPEPRDGIRINKQIGDFLKKLKA